MFNVGHHVNISNASDDGDLTICGTNDCQDPEVTARNIENYKPASILTLYILLSIMTLMITSAILIGKSNLEYTVR